MRSDHTRKSSLKKALQPSSELVAAQALSIDIREEDDLALHSLALDAAGQSPDRITKFKNDREVLVWCAAMALKSPCGSALIHAVMHKGWTVELDDLCGGGFHLNTETKNCVIDHHTLSPAALSNSVYFRHAVLLGFVRALRDIWHEESLGRIEDAYNPEDLVMLERFRSADGDCVAIHVGWELRGAGYGDVWRYILGSEESDIAQAYSRELERNPARHFKGGVLAAAFRQWHADETRVNASDHDALEILDDILSVSRAKNPFGSERLNGRDIEALSALPGGGAYLEGLGQSMLRDPFYAGLKDPVNQTHLLHIIYDLEVVMTAGVPFRDETLARKMFPGKEIVAETSSLNQHNN